MKSKVFLFFLCGIIIYAFSSCKDSGTTDSPQEEIEADGTYYPAGDGTRYKYEITKDSSGSQYTGTRSSVYSGTENQAGVLYQVQIDSVIISGLTSVNLSYFRKTDSGVFFYLDTTGFSTSVEDIDTLIQYLTLDTEMRLLFFPLSVNSSWTVFKVNLNYQNIINFNPLEVTASYDSRETLTLNLVSGSVNVETVKLKLTLKFGLNPFEVPRSFDAYVWIARDIGIVKWEGSGTVIGAFAGNGVDFDDTTSVVVMNIIDYDIN